MSLDIFNTLRFVYCEGGVTEVSYPFSEATDWRIFPFWVVAHNSGALGGIETATQSRLDLKHHSVAVIAPNVPHRFIILPGTKSLSRWCHVQYPVIHGLDISHFLEVPLIIPPGESAKEIAKINEMMFIIKNDTSLNDIAKSAKMKELGFALLGMMAGEGVFQNENILKGQRDDWILPVLEFVENNISETITRDKLAKIAALSPSRFHTVFKNAMNNGPMEFVRKSRITKASELLVQSKLPISKIAEKVGYKDQYVFSRTFKTETGISPLNFRKNSLQLLST